MRYKKVIILTMPLGSNYGGVLQAYALQRFVGRLGVGMVDTSTPTRTRAETIQKISLFVRNSIGVIFPKKRVEYVTMGKDFGIQNANILRFIRENISIIDLYTRGASAKDVIMGYDIAIIGSDQVWRAKYVKVLSYFLNFAKNIDIKRISYAASFGRDSLEEYGLRLIKKSAKPIGTFKAISVREYSGVRLCKDHWGLMAEQHVDPTLLLLKSEYVELVRKSMPSLEASKGNLFTYILDRDSVNSRIVSNITDSMGLCSFEVMPPQCASRKDFIENIDNYILPPVEQWLKSFMDAKFIVTDSFHGCVFSIIFNKPFIAIGNKKRGLARFDSLLKLFGLEDRLVFSKDDITDELLHKKIDWAKINKITGKERARSKKFLMDSLRRGPGDE